MYGPYFPGFGLSPVYLAGREHQIEKYEKMLANPRVYQNLTISGCRGSGKTVLLKKLSELSEQVDREWITIVLNPIEKYTLAHLTGQMISVFHRESFPVLQFEKMRAIFESNPKEEDQLFFLLEYICGQLLSDQDQDRGLTIAFDDFHTLDREVIEQLFYVFNLFQRNHSLNTIVAGASALEDVIKTSHYCSRAMDYVAIGTIESDEEALKALQKPLEELQRDYLKPMEEYFQEIVHHSRKFPYFLQFLGQECFELIRKHERRKERFQRARVDVPSLSIELDTIFFGGEWAACSPALQNALKIISAIFQENKFSIKTFQEYYPGETKEKVSDSRVAQMFKELLEKGLLERYGRGEYQLAIPMFADFVKRIAG